MTPQRSGRPREQIPAEGPLRSCEAWLFDLYPQGGEMVLWFIAQTGERLRLLDPFAPSFFIDGVDRLDARERKAFDRAVASLRGLERAGPGERLDFWTGQPRMVEEIRVTDLGRYGENLHRLFRQFLGLAYYNCDIPPEVHYGYHTGLFPTARCRVAMNGARLVSCEALDGPLDAQYDPPPVRAAELRAEGIVAGERPRLRSLSLECDGRTISWDEGSPRGMLLSLRDALREADPDLIWTRGGDSILLPALFAMAAGCKVDLGLDREPGVRRRLDYEGRSYMSYGRVLYQAPDYPLYGRWHIDHENSFWSGETGLAGLIEVARLSKIPVQRAARRSIGTGISSIQLDRAYREGFLIPWKKSQAEGWKSAATLLRADRGGLVYQPLVGVYEDVVELDFVSMYPTIMARCNVSPETINCACCAPEPGGDNVAPEIGHHTCRRRRGLVSAVLEPIIEKRKGYKRLMKALAARAESEAAARELRALYDGRQGAIKWLLVCCFGYLGYRNARFGRIEAHEATCAYSREKLLRAKEVSEARGFEVIHAIVDCVWLRRPGATAEEIESLCREIEAATGLDIAIEGRYRWIAFLPSRQDSNMPVPNRYFGRFEDGKLKFRGIEVRRHDQPPFAQEVQARLLERLRAAGSLAEVCAMREDLLGIVREAEASALRHEVPMERMILRRKTSRAAEDYRSNAMTAVAARQAVRAGIKLHAGESVAFIVISAKDRDPDSRLRLVSLLRPEDTYDAAFYAEQARRAAATVLEPLLGESLAAPREPRAKRPAASNRRAQGDFLAEGAWG